MNNDENIDGKSGLQLGVECIASHVKRLPLSCGVYRMLGQEGEVLYVGKAKSLKKRVQSYTKTKAMSSRLLRMVSQTRDMEFIETHTEAEALLLEANLIKTLKPKYNILLRDDKSFPYILITEDHDYPQIKKHRGVQKEKGDYYGPFANAGAVNKAVAALQRGFLLRNCSDNVFQGRTRPCLQYHIKRCTAPCVGYVSKEDYAVQVQDACDFMQGKSDKIRTKLQKQMQDCSDKLEFEQAAKYRNRLRALSFVQMVQDVNLSGLGDVDVFGLYREQAKTCIQVFFFRGGQNFGNRSYFPSHKEDDDTDDILSTFLGQFYQNKPIPAQMIVSTPVRERALLEDALSSKRQSEGETLKRVKIHVPQRGDKKRASDFAVKNAENAFRRKLAETQSYQKNLNAIAELFGLDDSPNRIEVYDNSHIAGQDMLGAMIVAGPEGFQKNSYRKFNIREAKSSDDFGMMREVFQRRFTRALQDGIQPDDENWPDLILIDGGKGQLNAAFKVFEELGIAEDIAVVAISKGPDRNAGREEFHQIGKPSFQFKENTPVLHYLQSIRDEAHRFAIGVHRSKRQKKISSSPLDGIAGIGAKRKKALLMYFGSAKNVSEAGIQDLQKVEGISQSIAEKIYNFFH